VSASLILAEAERLSASGMILMTFCVGLVLGLSGFCMFRLLRERKPSERHHAPLDIDTHDLGD